MTDTPRPFAWKNSFSDMHGLMRPSVVREILKLATKPDLFLFGGGLPDSDLLPASHIADISRQVLQRAASRALQYGATEGCPELQEQIARLATGQGRQTNLENILVTSGSQQAIDLLANVFLNSGDAIAVTRPCYLGALQIFERYNPRFLEISCDNEGPCLAEVEQALSQHPAFFYFVSIFQNPSGVSVTPERGRAIVELCHRYDVPIIEDGAYQELFFERRVVSLRQIEAQILVERGANYEIRGRVIFLGTFSKVLAPGLRVGWLEAPSEVTQAAALMKQAVDLHTSPMNQLVIAEFLQSHAEEHWNAIRSVYKGRRDAMVDAIDKHLTPWIVSRTTPGGGFFVWVEFDPSLNTTEMLLSAINRYGVMYTPGGAFFAVNPESNFMRLSFSTVAENAIATGIERLARAVSAEARVSLPQVVGG